MGVAPVTSEKARHLLVHHGVIGNGAAEIDELAVGRKLPVQQEITDGKEIGALSELVDRVSAIEQFALIAIDEGNAAGAIGRRGEAWIVGEVPSLFVEAGNINDIGSDCARPHLKIDGLAGDAQLGAFLCRVFPWFFGLVLNVHGSAPEAQFSRPGQSGPHASSCV